MDKQLIKRYLISTAVTFAAGFAVAILSEINDITIETFKSGAIVGVLFAATRAGVKAILEIFVAYYAKKTE